MRLVDRRVKIVGTMGPSTANEEMIEKLLRAGLNVARLNFSHANHDTHKKMVDLLRSVSKRLMAPIAILQDLQGPKIRVGPLASEVIHLNEGERVRLTSKSVLGTHELISVDLPQIERFVQAGHRVLFDDGLIELRVEQVDGDEVVAQVVFGGHLKTRKGVNLPEAHLPLEALTEKDLKDLEFGLSLGVDYVALSFVRKAKDIEQLKATIKSLGHTAKVVAKIEMLGAIDHLEEIVLASDAIMVARGDLAVEVGQTQMPRLQKKIIQLCNRMHRPVITATQMLESMVENSRPTRAEITDVANAVLDGSDAVMLSAETASGRHPDICVRTMHDIIAEVEKSPELFHSSSESPGVSSIPEAIAASSALGAQYLDAAAIICLTTTGRTATMISSFRPKAKIVAVSHLTETLNRLELAWGVQTLAIKPYRSLEEAMEQVETELLKYDLIRKGDLVVITLGTPIQEKSKTNTLNIHQVHYEETALPSQQRPLRFQDQFSK